MKRLLYCVACVIFLGFLSCSEDDNDVTNSTGGNSGKSTEEQKKDYIIEDMEKAFAMATVVDVETPGTLSTALPASKKYSTKSLKIRGAINGTDIVYLRDMMHKATGGELYALDLSECYIAKGGDCYYSIDKITKYYTKDNIVGNCMFDGCDLLRYIRIPAKTLSIKTNAFSSCQQLMYVDIGKTVKEMERDAFDMHYYPNYIEEYEQAGIEIKPIINVSDIASWCNMKHGYVFGQLFMNNDEIEELTIPDGVKIINSYSFAYCKKLNSVTIPSSVKIIREGAFGACPSLKSLTIPVGVDTIEVSAFSYSGLTSVSISSSVRVIRSHEGVNNPFHGCKDLSTIVVDGNNPIYDSRDNCNAIIHTASNKLIAGSKNTVIPNSVTSIGYDAFYGCSGLTSISIPQSVTSIGMGSFYGCSGLTSIKVESGNPIYDSRDNCNAIIITSRNLLKVGCKNTVIPNSVTIIGDRAFYGCSDLTSVNIPNSVTIIENCAFGGCSGLTSVNIPNSVTIIDQNAFWNCTNLATVKSYIKNPRNVNLESNSFPKNNATLYVPKGTIEDYRSSKWSDFFDRIEEGDY